MTAPFPLSGRDILYVSSIDWDDHWQGHQQIAQTLAKAGNRVLVIENTGVRSPNLRDFARIRRRAENAVRSPKGIRRIEERLWALAPMLLPFPYARAARLVNRELLTASLRRFQSETGFNPEIIFTYLPTPLVSDLIERLKPRVSVYYCIDDFAASSTGAREIRQSEDALIARADLVFVTAQKLLRRVEQLGRTATVFPFAVDIERFDAERLKDATIPVDLATLRRPVVGYIGALHRWVDQKLLVAVARKMAEVEFVLIGPDFRLTRELEGQPNIHLIGKRPHEELPRYLRGFDVGIIPYVRSDYTDAVYPTKLNEYLAMGLPVVATALPEIERFNQRYGALVSVATGADDFAAAIRQSFEGGSSSDRARRIAVAQQNSWQIRIPEMAQLIADKFR